jgi:hypothetical protein
MCLRLSMQYTYRRVFDGGLLVHKDRKGYTVQVGDRMMQRNEIGVFWFRFGRLTDLELSVSVFVFSYVVDGWVYR